MRDIWIARKKVGRFWLAVGAELRSWALPVHIDLQDNGIFALTVLCFYFEVEWGNTLADNMIEALKK